MAASIADRCRTEDVVGQLESFEELVELGVQLLAHAK